MPTYEELLRENEQLKSSLIQKDSVIQGLTDLVALLRRKQFGKSSEKVSNEQLGMFDEAEIEAQAPEVEDEESIKVPEHERKRGKRLKLPENLEIIPAKVRVIRTIRKKYACSVCERIEAAPAPLEMIPKSNASGSVLAYIATAKYVDALPLYRQEAIFKRAGLDLSRQTMARWMIQVGEKVTPLITLLREELLKSSYIHMDETIVQVLKEDGKKEESNSYMWVQARSGPQPIVLFHYAKNRSGNI